MIAFFRDRHEAGVQLGKKLLAYLKHSDAIVLALPRGGVPVAFEIAKALHLPLDLMLVRKLGVPGGEELAMGAIAMNNICVFNHDVISNFSISDEIIERVIATETEELLRRNKVYRGGKPAPDLKDKTVILIDDGIATGANMRAAVSAVAQQQPARIIVAVPVASEPTCEVLGQLADEVICLQIPKYFYGVGGAYEDFSPTTDEEVVSLLETAHGWGKGAAVFGEHNKHTHRGIS